MTSDNQNGGHVSGVDGSLPRHFLRSALHIALLPGRSHGYDLFEQVKLFGLSSVDLAGVYRAMKSMERDALVSSEWESSELGPPRRVYQLTNAGHIEAAEHLRSLRAARDLLDFILGSATIDIGQRAR